MQPDDKKEVFRPWYLSAIILFMIPLMGMGVDLYAPSLPWIVNSLHTTAPLVKLTIALYLFGYAVGPVIAGTPSDIYGRRPVLIVGMVIYIVSCLLILLFQNIDVMLAMRFVQGIAAGFIGLCFRTMMSDSFKPGVDMQKMSASAALAWSTGPVVAPFIGGYLQHYFGWQSNFVLFLIYAVLILLVAIFILPETNQNKASWHLGTVLGHYKTVLSCSIFWGGVVCMGAAYAVIIFFNVIGPFLVQNVLHYNAIEFGYIALVMGLAFMTGNIVNRELVKYFPVSKLMTIGGISSVSFSVILLLLGLFKPVSLWAYTVPIFFIMFSSSFVFPNAMSWIIALFPRMAGAASAMIGLSFSAIAGVATVVASFLEAKTQVPIAIAYVVVMSFCLFCYYALMRGKTSRD